MAEPHRVAVVMGGTSPEREISMVSGKAIAEGLRQAGETVHEVVANDDHLRELDDLLIDVVFIALHGTWGEDGGIQQLLESKGLPYTGSGVKASRRGMDKLLSKEAFAAHGVPTAPYESFAASDPLEEIVERAESLGFPVVVKPRAQGSSIGVSIVRRPGDLSAAVADALQYGPDGLLERYVAGRELTVGILDGGPLPIIELRFILEVNTIPGFTPVSLFPEAAKHQGIDFPELCYRLVALALRDQAEVQRRELTNQRGG